MPNKLETKEFKNFKDIEDKLKDYSSKELEMFDNFYQDIKQHAINQKQITLNNLKETQASLSELKEKASQLKDSVFYHEEETIVNRQEIIADTENKIHKENLNILNYEYNQANDKIDSLDYLNKASIQTKFTFFDRFKGHYANQIIEYDDFYKFYQNKFKEFNNILATYNNKILEFFQKLDDQITDMDSKILLLIQQKNSKLNNVNTFYTKEIENYLDNQLTFIIEEDVSSISIQALISDKMSQLDTFKSHLYHQEEKVKKILNDEYLALYNKTLDRLLKRKGNLIAEDTSFFEQPKERLLNLKEQIIKIEKEDPSKLGDLINKYKKATNYQDERKSCEIKAKKMIKNFMILKKQIYLEYQKDNRNLIFQIEKYFNLYLKMMDIDPFLAQIIGDNSTKIIKDEINFLNILKINKEHKINVEFDIKTLNLKQQINKVEVDLKYQAEKLMLKEDMHLLEKIKDIQLFFVEYQGNSLLIKNSLLKEKYIIERLEESIDEHMKYLVTESNINRKFSSIITQILETKIRNDESRNIKIVNASSDIILALKEYDILALHYNTMYENEKRFLIMQASRISEETLINNQFILTTFENQMRFAKEQISLANDEYRLRMEAILMTINEERNYYFDIIKNKINEYKNEQSTISDKYLAKLYHDSLTFNESTDKSQKKSLEKNIVKNKNKHDNLINSIEEKIKNDQIIFEAKKRIDDLNIHFEQAVENATNIRDDTIKEMTDLYQIAEKKANLLKPYLNDKVNILDPTIYKSLEDIKARHLLRIKEAENILDKKTKDQIENYLKEYFKEGQDIDKNLYLAQIDQVELEKQNNQAEYSQNLQSIDNLYHSKIADLAKEANTVNTKVEQLRFEIISKNEKSLNQIKSDLENLEKRYLGISEQQLTSFQTEINNLTAEYSNSYNQNQKYFENLSNAFTKILNSYLPYLKLAQNNKTIKKIIKDNNRQIQNKKNAEFKKLERKSKFPDYLFKKN